MDLSNVNERGDVDDRRGSGGGRRLMIGGGIGGVIIVLLGAFGLISPEVQQFLQALVGGQQQVAQEQDDNKPAPKDGQKEFAEKIVGSSNAVWQEQFRKHYGKDYKKPRMELFTGGVNTGCGSADSGVGPFYCPADEKVYLDPTFFGELEKRLHGSAADFSKAYVITHEVGHHVQHLLGYDARLRNEGFERRERENAGIRLELMADYLAGVWAHHADQKYHLIEKGDIDQAFKSAEAIGDDTLQRRGRGTVNPDSFTHGSSAQRLAFFRDGLKTGDASKPALDHFFDERIDPKKLMPVR